MKCYKLIWILLLLNSSLTYGQTDSIKVNDWEKILILDAYGGWHFFKNEFQILRENHFLTSQNKTDSIIKKIDPVVVDSLLASLKNPSNLKSDPMKMFGLDSTWLIENAETLWNEYNGTKTKTKEINEIAIGTIKNYSQVKNSLWALQGSHWTDDYPYVEIRIIKGIDTLSISSEGQYPYMLPWKVNGKGVFNAEISKLISTLLPDSIRSNKARLLGKQFNHYLIERIFRNTIQDTIRYIEAKKRYGKYFNYLEKDFQIRDAEMSDMSSIEWGGWFARKCVEFELSDSTISNNIRFSTIFSRNNILHSPKSISKNKNKLLKRLQDNPIYTYTLDCKNCLGEIHWVKSKSLSGQAKRSFLADVKENGKNKSEFRGRFNKAVFYELTEMRDSKRSFSRWIFLKDGTIILWQINGTYLLHLPDEIIKNQGYVCRIISPEEFKSSTP